ncbi:unnamed protein product [Clavelina lepadiformis]|uniref:RING-type domain-containing protein n=1 Tax=Clavelina lepadiformis TaxID=159417 RepID=A0ABP0F9A3_CLALP
MSTWMVYFEMSLRGACTICTDYFDTENSISVTPCGHLFHTVCLFQWIETCGAQKTCPQCRSRVTVKQIVEKIFLNLGLNDNESQLDPYVLKNKLDEVELKLKNHDAEKDDLKSKIRAMETAKNNLKAKVEKLKGEVKSEKNIVHLLKADMETMKYEVEDAKACKEETKRLRIRLKTLEKIEVILNGQKNDVENMLKQYNTVSASTENKQLATFCVALKQEFERIKDSRAHMNSELMKCKRDLHKKEEMLINKASFVEELENANAQLQKNEEALNEENRSLRRKLAALQQAIASPNDTKSSAINRLIAESPAPEFITPINGFAMSKSKRAKDMGSPIRMKKPKLSSSFGSKDVDLDESGDLFADASPMEDAQCMEKENEEPIFPTPTDSPTTVKMRKHCEAMGLNFVKTTSSVRTNVQKFGKCNLSHSASLRNKLINNRQASGKPSGYDGLGGHKKLLPSRSSFVKPSSSLKFSSSNTSKFQIPTTSFSTSKSRFDRLKKVGPR